MGAFLNHLLAVFFPNRCYICDAVLRYPETVCEACGKKVIRYGEIRGAVCDVCGLKPQECVCRPGRFYEKAVFPLFFEDEVRASLHKLKFRGRLDKVQPFANAIYNAMKERGVLEETDALTYIPMDRRHEKKRGYNQAQLLCAELHELTGLPVFPLLYKCEQTGTQHDIQSFLFRSGNALGIFEPVKENLSRIEGKRILIADDILTTGSTMNEAAKTLLIFGADTVYAAAAAAVPRRKKPKKEPQNKT